jgi:ribonuclease R
VRGRWTFDPSKHGWPGRCDLAWRGRHVPDDGDFCIAEIDEDGKAWLVEVLGADDRPQWDDHAIASQFRLRTRFPADGRNAAEAAHEPGARDRAGREDLRDRLAFTIDPEDAQDHDDALSIEPAGEGRWEVGVHIADVSHYVAEDGAIEHEAFERGTSTYLPTGVIPMLPARLSNDLCSLRPDRDRLALSVFVTLDAHGRRHAVRFAETVIRSRHRLAYGDVQAWFDDGRMPGHEPTPELGEALTRLRALARALRANRLKRGALELDVPEVRARVDADGGVLALERRVHLESHELVEEFMLLANRCVGEEGARRSAGLLYRVHEPPSPRKLAELDDMLKTLGLPRPGRLDDPARALQAVLGAPLDERRRRIVHRLVLRSMTRARYLEGDAGHFGLATREYCHFTSPIRRYPDLHNHRRVREWLHGRPTGAWDPVALTRTAARATATEQNAADAEREAVKVKGLRALEPLLGDSLTGTITGFVRPGFFVELDEVPVEGFVRVALYLEDHFVLDASGVRMTGRRTRTRFSLGDAVQVTVARVDVPARECDLALDPTPRRRKRHPSGRI